MIIQGSTAYTGLILKQNLNIIKTSPGAIFIEISSLLTNNALLTVQCNTAVSLVHMHWR